MSPRLRDARGFTIGELLIVMLIVGALFAVAIPLMRASRMAGNESSAVGSLRAILSSQASYSNLNGGFAGSLEQLAARCPGMDVGFAPEDITRTDIAKSGYILRLSPGAGASQGPLDCNGMPTVRAFYVSARPEVLGSTGARAFATTEGTIWQNTSGFPPTEPFVPSATVSVLK